MELKEFTSPLFSTLGATWISATESSDLDIFGFFGPETDNENEEGE